MVLGICGGMRSSNQVLLNVVAPLRIVIAAIGVTAAVVAHPAARAAERHLVTIGAPVGV